MPDVITEKPNKMYHDSGMNYEEEAE